MDSNNEIPSSSFIDCNQAPHSGCCSLLPTNAIGPQHVLPLYPSSTLHYYYPSPHHAPNYAHISSPLQTFRPLLPVLNTYGQMPLPSVSQLHIPSLRHMPSIPSLQNIFTQHVLTSPLLDQRNNDNS